MSIDIICNDAPSRFNETDCRDTLCYSAEKREKDRCMTVFEYTEADDNRNRQMAILERLKLTLNEAKT